MKRISLYFAAIFCMAACSGTVDPEGGDVNNQVMPDEYVEPFTLAADKTEVDANGKDYVTFSLKDSFGREMLQDKNALQSINITSAEGIRVPRMQTKVAFIANGTYNFSATYSGRKSANTVLVEVKNRAKYEVYHRNVGLFKCTSVWCSACPHLGSALHGLSESTKDHSVVLSIHGNYDGQKDPFSLYVSGMDLGSYVMARFGLAAWPTLVYDMNHAVAGTAPTSDIDARILERRIQSPATCGIKVASVKVEGTALKVKASMKSSTGGDYDLACAVMRDGLVYQGGFSIDSEGIYDEVVISMSESALGYYKGEEVAEGDEYEEEFSFDFGDSVPSEDQLANLYVAVYAYRKTKDGSTMDNIVTCRYNESVDYRLNE